MKDFKEKAKRLWNANPCGGEPQGEDGNVRPALEYFHDVRRRRYEVSDTWIPKTIDFGAARGKRLLEIGFGIGTDLLSFCEGGAEVFGIDITNEHHRLASLNFELHGKRADLRLCDAAEIDFPSDYFDFVYTLGVLHHTPDTVRCISEAFRVLKEGGRLILGLYYTYSAFHLVNLLFYHGLIKGKLRSLGYRGLLSTVERGADGANIAPLVKTYSRRQLRWILSDFSSVEFRIAHFRRDHVPYAGRFIPESWEDPLGSHIGWYVIAFATK